MMEQWRDVKGYEGLYEVSNLGRVRSLNYRKTGKIRELSGGKNSGGYLQVSLCKDGKRKEYLVHRLVAEAFIPNPDNLPCVNHKDENKTNNIVTDTVSNLEWCTAKYNLNYGTHNQRVAASLSIKLKNHPSKSKRVYQYTKSGSFVRSYPSTCEAKRQTGIANQRISECCNGNRNHAGGYIWSYDPPTPSTTRVLW